MLRLTLSLRYVFVRNWMMVPSLMRVPVLKDERFMKGSPAIYLGRLIPKENFRAFIYAPNGNKRLVESWDEFEANMQTGLWFATESDALKSVAQDVKKERKRTPKPKKEEVLAVQEPCKIINEPPKAKHVPQDGLGFEVTNDDFLPNEGE